MASPPTILIACSNPQWSQSLTETLGAWGIEVVCAATVEEARQILCAQALSLVFAEQNLPGGGLRELLKELAPWLPTVRLIALIQDETEYGEAIHAGAFDAITNPFPRPEVQWMVIQALNDADSSTRRSARA
jgi:DNA-binding NtrC family response regulator